MSNSSSVSSNTRKTTTWFETVFGFPEERQYDNVRLKFRIENDGTDDATLHTTVPPGSTTDNSEIIKSRQFHIGKFETPSVQALRNVLSALSSPSNDTNDSCDATNATNSDRIKNDARGLSFEHIVGDVGKLHRHSDNNGAVVQVASQFNCLEMISPRHTPNDGITIYANDQTQGPICALACPAGTLYRNYFIGENGNDTHTGQGGLKSNQIDNLEDIDKYLHNTPPPISEDELATINDDITNIHQPTRKNKYWKMENGYALPSRGTSIRELGERIEEGGSELKQNITSLLRVGVHWSTEVWNANQNNNKDDHRVTQVFSSALPIGYDNTLSTIQDWEPFARLVLNGTYEATLLIASILARQKGERIKVFLTKVGGGVFGNPSEWIESSIRTAIDKFEKEPIDIYLVHYGSIEESFLDSLPVIIT